METTFIGLVDVVEDRPKVDLKAPKSFTTIIDHVMQTEYDGLIDRPLTPVAVLTEHKSKVSLGHKAIWDTGSRTSCISKELAKRLNLPCIGTATCIVPNGALEAPMYYVDIQISDEIVFENVRVTEYPLENHDCDILIGMDIISKGKLIIDSTSGKTIVSFSV